MKAKINKGKKMNTNKYPEKDIPSDCHCVHCIENTKKHLTRKEELFIVKQEEKRRNKMLATKRNNMLINYKEIKKLKSFYDVKLKGNETFDQLLKIERDFNERIKQDTKNIQSIDNQTRRN